MSNSHTNPIPEKKDEKIDQKQGIKPASFPLFLGEYENFCREIHPEDEYDEGFRANLTQFYENPPRKESVPLHKLSDLLDHSFIVGEKHSDMSPKKFLIDHLSEFKEAGFKTLYMEHLFYDHQNDLDDYFETGKMNDRLSNHLREINSTHGFLHHTGPDCKSTLSRWNKYNFTALIEKAREAHIRIVGIDISTIYLMNQIAKQRNVEDNTRIRYMNYTAYRIINREQGGRENKWLALMGNTHVKTLGGTPGMSDMLGVNSVLIFDTGNEYKKALETYSLKESELDQLSKILLNTECSLPPKFQKSFPVDVLIKIHPDLTTPALKPEIKLQPPQPSSSKEPETPIINKTYSLKK